MFEYKLFLKCSKPATAYETNNNNKTEATFSPIRQHFYSLCSGLVKLSALKAPPLPVRSLPVADSVDGACEDEEEETVVRRRNRKSTAAEGVEVKVRGRRQRDFDPSAVEEEEVEPQENREKADPSAWTQNQQKLLELALQQFPRGTAERWDRIAKVVPGKTKVRIDSSLVKG